MKKIFIALLALVMAMGLSGGVRAGGVNAETSDGPSVTEGSDDGDDAVAEGPLKCMSFLLRYSDFAEILGIPINYETDATARVTESHIYIDTKNWTIVVENYGSRLINSEFKIEGNLDSVKDYKTELMCFLYATRLTDYRFSQEEGLFESWYEAHVDEDFEAIMELPSKKHRAMRWGNYVVSCSQRGEDRVFIGVTFAEGLADLYGLE